MDLVSSGSQVTLNLKWQKPLEANPEGVEAELDLWTCFISFLAEVGAV